MARAQVARQIIFADFRRRVDNGDSPKEVLTGKEALLAFAATLVRRLTDRERRWLRDWVVATCAKQGDGHEIRSASMCSGTDSPVLVWDALAAALSNTLGFGVSFRHVFSVEKDRAKQDFLVEMFPFLFDDVINVAGLVATDVKSKTEECPVPADIRLVVAGFPCKDLSLLNPKAGPLEHVFKR